MQSVSLPDVCDVHLGVDQFQSNVHLVLVRETLTEMLMHIDQKGMLWLRKESLSFYLLVEKNLPLVSEDYSSMIPSRPPLQVSHQLF